MSTNPEGVQASESGKSGLARLALLSLLTGAAIDLVIGCFRVALKHMSTDRTDTITWAHRWPVLGFVLVCPQFVADSGATPVTFAIAGMAAFLTATVRAPVTGMILIFEMTGAFNQALPMLWASFAAMAVPTLMGNSPIYDSMKARTIGIAKTM